MKITPNTQFKTLVKTWLCQKQPMITPSTYANFVLISENHLIPYMGKKKISAINEADIQTYINTLFIRTPVNNATRIPAVLRFIFI